MEMVVLAAVPGIVVLGLMTLTTIGARRRGLVIPLAALAGVCFPVTWAVWYVRDEHPHRRAAQNH